MSKTRHLSDKEIYQEVCDDVSVDVAFTMLVSAILDDPKPGKNASYFNLFEKRIIDAVEKLRDREVEVAS